MALQPLSIGDILMLSQQAWKIGRAFKQGKNSAPSEFAEVESEANGLSEALKLTAETLHADGSILSQAEPETRGAVNDILDSAGRTLGDLESFVERYQVIRKRSTGGGGFAVERSWSEAIMANYKTLKWTTEGGDISELRNMLHMHTNTINLTMQALQSRSLARLEKTVVPMAENISDIHSRVNGDLGEKIDDLHRIIMAVASNTPSLVARDRSLETNQRRIQDRNSNLSGLDIENENEHAGTRLLEAPPERITTIVPGRQQDRQPHDSAHSTPAFVSPRAFKPERPPIDVRRPSSARGSGRMDWDFEHGSPPHMRGSFGGPIDDDSRPSTMDGSPDPTPKVRRPHPRESSAPRRESTTLPNMLGALSVDDTAAGSSRISPAQLIRNQSYDGTSPRTPTSRIDPYASLKTQPGLPPPAIPPTPTGRTPQSPATPSSFFGPNSRSRSESHKNATRSPTTKAAQGDSSPLTSALSSLPAFEKSLFRNAAILCDVRAKLVEYAQKIPEEADPRYDTEMVEACQECRVCVIRKRENRAHGGTKLATSIWAISEDGVVRCQQRLSETVETVPYCSYFEQEKVSIPPTEGEINLKFHGETWTDELDKEIKTTWVNYIFVSENDAISFQSAVFGRLLIGSFRTMKTTVVHDGIKGAFAFEEQFANIEMLRLWEDDGVATPGAQGGVLALMHISSNFGEGWARWWMNSSIQQVRVKDDGQKYAKLKGLDVVVLKPGSIEKARTPSMASDSLHRVDTAASTKSLGLKKVTGVRIEFKTDEEKNNFIDMSRRAQNRMIPLPDL